MILAPACPPTKEAAAAGRMNRQFMGSMAAYPKKPVKEEKHTMKMGSQVAFY